MSTDTIHSNPAKRMLLRFLAVFAMATALMFAYGCGERGNAEKAGEQIDEAVDETKDLFEPDGPAEEAGEDIDDAVDEVTE